MTRHRIKAHPSVTFTVVVNPGNGPGPESVPDACYTAEIPRLTAYPNVRLVGYVHASYTRRDLGLVLRDVTKYSGWAERSGIPGLAVQGIFVDETPNQYDEKAAQYLTELTNAVKESAGLSPTNTVRLPFLALQKQAFLAAITLKSRLCADFDRNGHCSAHR